MGRDITILIIDCVYLSHVQVFDERDSRKTEHRRWKTGKHGDKPVLVVSRLHQVSQQQHPDHTA